METSIKNKPAENRFEFRLTTERVGQLQAHLAGSASDDLLREWWGLVCGELGFVANSVADVRWTMRGGRVLAVPPKCSAVDCAVSFTAIAYPRGLPDDLGHAFRDWLVGWDPKMIWPEGSSTSGTYFHPHELEEAFNAGRNMPNLPDSGPLGANFDENHTGLPENDQRAVDPVSGIETKSELPPFAVTTGDPRFNPSEPVTINGYSFIPGNLVTTEQIIVDEYRKAVRAIQAALASL